MANIIKGEAAKTEVISVRITKAERRDLESQYGTSALGIRALLAAARIGRNK